MSSFVERRRPAFAPELLARVGFALGIVTLVVLLTSIPTILAMRFPDPDDTLRLVQVRDLVAGQGWFDLTQHRIDAPNGGVPMHWSRLVDIPVAIVIIALSPLIGTVAAETVALVVVPLVTLAIALLLAGRIAWRLMGEEVAVLACLAMALSVPLLSQMRPLRIDHHGWQVVFALAVLNGLMARSPRIGGWVAGVSMAAWLAISIEGLPLVFAVCGVTALRWMRSGSGSAWLVSTTQGLAGGSLILFLALRGPVGLTQYCDVVGAGHIAGFAVAAIGVLLLARCEPMPPAMRVGGLVVTGIAAGAALLAVAPSCANGTFNQLDPLVFEFWYDRVHEGLPVWRQDLSLALQSILPPLIGLVASLRLARASGGWLRIWWTEYALVLGAALLITVFVIRAGAVAGALAAVPLGWQINAWLRAARTVQRPGRRALVMATLVLTIMPAFPLTLMTMAMPARADDGKRAPRVSECRLSEGVAALRKLPRGEILTPIDLGPQLLYETQHTVVASGHHRGAASMKTVISTFLGSEAEARDTLRARGTRYVAICPDLNEPMMYEQDAPRGFMASLLRGRAPRWLEPVPVPQGSALKVWRIAD
ncbi:hypothetical protein GRI40_08780 [Altererythrobacter aerius]|uniref:AcrB/AcrD/AcrF family protein n=1 Tax=Tsuneonella aeria TaxID=1837929 RepID=A0A6I4TFC7_9SPHN|nr:hypothetical protein [Tsuneonella aeria]MXO75306.1 hypothetical protein [Tsuneonella aeria]